MKKGFEIFQFNRLQSDALSGLVVFLVALPLCLGIAMASGAPLFSGIVAGVVGGVMIGILSSSQVSVSGPAAGLTIVVLNAIKDLGSFDAFLLAVVLSGAFQTVLGVIKAGIVSNFVPSAILKGMLAAIGLILVLSQIPHALGFDSVAEGELRLFQTDGKNIFGEIFRALGAFRPGAVIISLFSIGLLLFWQTKTAKKYLFFKMMPGALVVVIFGVLLNQILPYFRADFALSGNQLVNLPILKDFSDLSFHLTSPNFNKIVNIEVWKTALLIAVVSSIVTLLNIEAADKLDPLKRATPPNRELIAQGIGNMASGILGGLPITSVIVRTSVNIYSGAQTKLSSIFHGLLLAISVFALAKYINQITLASLSAILIFTGYKLARISLFRAMYLKGQTQFIPFIVTILAILLTNLLSGLLIGLAVGFFFLLRANFEGGYRLRTENKDGYVIYHIELNRSVSFLNKASLTTLLNQIPEGSEIIINGTQSEFIDPEVREIIEDFKEKAVLKKMRMEFSPSALMAPEIIVKPRIHQIPREYADLFKNNRKWVEEKLALDPDYFEKLSQGQAPKFLFIGCSDSRVPANEITGTEPGEMFVHRNIANMVVNTDLNMLSVLQYAVEVLKVEHVIVCGHYGCGGVKAAMTNYQHGLIDKWLHNIKDVYRLHRDELNSIHNDETRFRRMVELNVREQVYNLHKTGIIQRAFKKDAALHVHGWVYDIHDGLLTDLNVDVEKDFDSFNIYAYRS